MKPFSTKPCARGVLAAALMAALLAGCASPETRPSADPTVGVDQFDAAMEEVFGFTLEEADENGVSPVVIELLEGARERGRVSYSDLVEAINDALVCFDESGIGWERLGGTDQFGMPSQDYQYWAPAGFDTFSTEWLPLADACQLGSGIVRHLYDNQPLSVDSQTWFTEHQKPVVTACLVERGVTVAEGADVEWFMQASKNLLDETGDDTCIMLMYE